MQIKEDAVNSLHMLIALVAIGVSGCSNMEILRTFDQHNDTKILSMIRNNINVDIPKGTVMQLDASTSERRGDIKTYLKVNIFIPKPNWIIIDEGNELMLNVDGNEIKLKTIIGSKWNREEMYSDNKETAIYNTDIDTIKEIGNAKSVTIKIEGTRGKLKGKLNIYNLDYFAKYSKEVALELNKAK